MGQQYEITAFRREVPCSRNLQSSQSGSPITGTILARADVSTNIPDTAGLGVEMYISGATLKAYRVPDSS